MSSETVDWLKKVSKNKSKVSFDLDEEEGAAEEATHFVKPKSNAIKNNYTSKDLTGLQVAHDFGSFQAGQSDILVLEDSSVLDSEGKEGNSLVSMALKEDERLKRLREVARHAGGYSGYKEYEAEDSVVTLGRVKSSKVLQKYDFASTEFTDEPAAIEGFRIGSQQTKAAVDLEEKKLDNSNDFDAVQSAGIEILNLKRKKPAVSEIEKEKKRAKKLAKTLFADEPEMLIDQIFQTEDGIKYENTAEEEEEDLEMQKIISATRREHLKTGSAGPMEIEPEIEDKFIGGKSFDALMMTESIFVEKDSEVAERVEESSQSDFKMDLGGSSDDEREIFNSEPLVRNGVAATLALLNMRGINLKPRTQNTTKQPSSDIKLEYFDQFGNKLTSKEAYKELSRKFHGKGPGKGKIEKMKRRREVTLKLESASVSAATQSAIVTNLRKQQEETGVPYMILSSTRQIEPTPSSIKEETEVKKPKIFGFQIKK